MEGGTDSPIRKSASLPKGWIAAVAILTAILAPEETGPPQPRTVVLNWTAGLKKSVPEY